ncbi:MAG: sensor histidine kinase [Bacteroidota bacterium]
MSILPSCILPLLNASSVWLGLVLVCNMAWALPESDSLRQALHASHDQAEKAILSMELSRAYRLQIPDSAIHYAQEVLNLTQYTQQKALRIQALTNLGILYKRKGEYKQALAVYRQALYLHLEVQDEVGVANIYDKMAVVLRYTGEYEEALSYHHKSIDLALNFDSPKLLGQCYSDLANLYADRANYDLAAIYYAHSLSIRNELNDSIGIARICNNLANTYYLQESYREAQQYYARSLAMFQLLGYRGEQARILSNLGNLAYQDNALDQALEYWNQALSLATELEDLQTQMTLLHQIGLIHLERKRYVKGNDILKSAARIGEEMGQWEMLADLYPKLAESYQYIGNDKQAFLLLNRSLELKDSLNTVHGSERFSELTALYETERTERQLAETKHQLAESRKTQILLGSGILVLLLLAAIAGIFLYHHRKVQRSERKLIHQREELNRQIIIDLMKAQEVESLNSMLEGQEQERQRIAADLHDSLGGTLAAVKVSLFTLQKKLSGQSEDASKAYTHTRELLEEAYKEVRRISHNLTDNALEHEGLGRALDKLCKTLKDHSGLLINLETSGLDTVTLDGKTEIQLYRIVQEIFQNIIKHACADKVSLQLSLHRDRLNLLIEDDGVGFEYEPEKIHEGIGLFNISRRVKQMRGTLEIDSAPGQGTTTIIDLPL